MDSQSKFKTISTISNKRTTVSSTSTASLDDDTELIPDEHRVIRHIIVVGFHHKHGYQLDYCYPPLTPNGPVFSTPQKPIILPSEWKTLPILCLPDGSHNYKSDTIYFTMPDLTGDDLIEVFKDDSSNNASQNDSTIKPEGIKTIFGTACYRQISVDKLVKKTDDMTRLSVQKSVCVLSKKPLFGLIRSKLEMITHAYFQELDFSKVKILKLTYHNLNSLLQRDSVKENAIYLGLSTRESVATFSCNLLVLFKAILLEKKILFYKTPVRELCTTILSICSLFTGLLELGGLDRSTCDLKLSPSLIEALKLSTTTSPDNDCDTSLEDLYSSRDDKVFFNSEKEEVVIVKDPNYTDPCLEENVSRECGVKLDGHNEYNDTNITVCDIDEQLKKNNNPNESNGLNTSFEIIAEETLKLNGIDTTSSQENLDAADDDEFVEESGLQKLCRMDLNDIGLPLQIFSRGSFCLPYLSITYLDLLSDPRVKSFVIGATNFLFKQKSDAYDLIVDMEENSCKIDIIDPALRKYLSLTTEDLRFVDYLNRNVKIDKSKRLKDEFDFMNQDITKWIGSDEWIRYMFKVYTLYLLRAVKFNVNLDTFNLSFTSAWKKTNNYKIWDSLGKSQVLANLKNKHPCSTGKGINFNDMKLRFSYAVNSSEKGKLINQTLNGISKWSIWSTISQAPQIATSNIHSGLRQVKSASSSKNDLTENSSGVGGIQENKPRPS